jgi:hypothetical protein
LEEVYPEPHWIERGNQRTTPVTKCGHIYIQHGGSWGRIGDSSLKDNCFIVGLITTGASPENVAARSCRWLNTKVFPFK